MARTERAGHGPAPAPVALSARARLGFPMCGPVPANPPGRSVRGGQRWRDAACGLAALALCAFSFAAAQAGVTPELLSRIQLPPGFSIAVYSEVPGARNLAVSPNSRVVLVTDRDRTLFAVADEDGDYVGDTLRPLQQDLNAPSGLVLRDGFLYVAEQQRVRRADFDEKRPFRLLLWKAVKTGLPSAGQQGTHEIAIGPDGRLYLAVGVACNICRPEGDRDAILSMRIEGGGETVFARGVRNSVGMDFHPVTGQLWFTDNGVDSLGDDIPPDELNRAERAGQHFGYPWYGGGSVRTPDFLDDAPPPDVVFPAVELQAHSAPLGIHFYLGTQFPPDYRNSLFVVEHGSWNRPVPTGYRILRVHFDESGNPARTEVFARGWLRPEGPWGRPSDVTELGDGSLLVSDDLAGVIYRITYSVR
jgi:glucose/arabinose dehydrogenase